MPFTIAIDGPAASGKGTLAKRLAAHFGFAHLDTGLLYRAVGAQMLTGVEPVDAAQNLTPEALDADALRRPEIAQAASKVAALPQVRAALTDFQRAFARRSGGAVLDGRDIGTVICPEAEVKLFVTASADVRARRRHAELLSRGLDSDLAQVYDDVIARDRRDSDRAEAPMRPADDAVIFDTSEMDIETAFSQARQLVEAAMSNVTKT